MRGKSGDLGRRTSAGKRRRYFFLVAFVGIILLWLLDSSRDQFEWVILVHLGISVP